MKFPVNILNLDQKTAQQSVHLTLERVACAQSQAVFYALAFFPGLSSRTGWLDDFAKIRAAGQLLRNIENAKLKRDIMLSDS